MLTPSRARALIALGLIAIPAVTAAQEKAATPAPAAASDDKKPGREVRVPAAVGGGWGFGFWNYYQVGTPGGIYVMVPPMMGRPAVPVVIERGPLAAPPPPDFLARPAPEPAVRKVVRRDPAKSAQMLTLGDRMFRGGNLKKAEDRYLQAARFDAQAAAPLVRLAQVALVREHYAVAAQRLREAETVQPGWLATAPDVQALFGEPGDFARHLGRLETYLQVHPADRDAWLVLGAEFFLSGRTARAGDVFVRLDDRRRKPDIALAAFLEASRRD